MKSRLYLLFAVFTVAMLTLSTFTGASASEGDDPYQVVYDELFRLEGIANALPADYQNPPAMRDNFNQLPVPGAGTWDKVIVNGMHTNTVNQGFAHHYSYGKITRQKNLELGQILDPNFGQTGYEYYNNIALIGMAGYVPTETRDVVFGFKMRVDPGYHGTTGMFLEPVGTFDDGGNFTMPADWFGVSYAGPTNYNAGVQCNYIVSWMPLAQQPIDADPFTWNNYEIRLSMIDQTYMNAEIFVNGQSTCSQVMPRVPMEVQLWSDNYELVADENWNVNIGFSNYGPQAVRYDNLTARAVRK